MSKGGKSHAQSDRRSSQVANGSFDGSTQDFAFECPIHVFKAADQAQGKQRRVAGVISTDNPDRQREVILQDGLDFADFINHGWFNDNHSAGTTDILGYPETVKSFDRGQTLPDGSKAATNCTWVEGYLVNTKKADQVWELAEALQGTNRRLGYSVEGSIEKRSDLATRTIAKAKIRNVAITNCPVNTDARLEVLARSLSAMSREPVSKTMSMAVAGTVGPDVAKPDTSTQATALGVHWPAKIWTAAPMALMTAPKKGVQKVRPKNRKI